MSHLSLTPEYTLHKIEYTNTDTLLEFDPFILYFFIPRDSMDMGNHSEKCSSI